MCGDRSPTKRQEKNKTDILNLLCIYEECRKLLVECAECSVKQILIYRQFINREKFENICIMQSEII